MAYLALQQIVRKERLLKKITQVKSFEVIETSFADYNKEGKDYLIRKVRNRTAIIYIVDNGQPRPSQRKQIVIFAKEIKSIPIGLILEKRIKEKKI